MNRQDSEKLITLAAADLLISHRDGDMTLLYLYLCRTGCTDREKAGVDLFMPRQASKHCAAHEMGTETFPSNCERPQYPDEGQHPPLPRTGPAD